MPFPSFDRSRLKLKPLSERIHDLSIQSLLPLEATSTYTHPHLAALIERIRSAKRNKAAMIWMIGAHVLRAGVQRQLIALMEHGWITHLAMNGAGPIHDWELAHLGATTESVARYIRTGEFGLWTDTGVINDVLHQGRETGLGMGELIGQHIERSAAQHRAMSVLAAGYRLQVPVTVHVGIGYDIIHEHPNCHGASLGQTSYTDFLIFAESVRHLEGGVILNFGSAVMGPEIYLKALSMARNVEHQEGRSIGRITSAVFDLLQLDDDWQKEAPKSDPRYYYRPWKTILVRTAADGGQSFYFQGDHRDTVVALYHALQAQS